MWAMEMKCSLVNPFSYTLSVGELRGGSPTHPDSFINAPEAFLCSVVLSSMRKAYTEHPLL
jgi:hypothetical protein